MCIILDEVQQKHRLLLPKFIGKIYLFDSLCLYYNRKIFQLSMKFELHYVGTRDLVAQVPKDL